MNILRIYPSSVNDRFISQAAETLRRGGIIIYPTDGLYALGCSAVNQQAIEKLCRIKGLNPQKNTLSAVCADISQASRFSIIDNASFSSIRSHTPGPFTFILPASNTLPKAFKGRRTVGIRIPDNRISTALAAELDAPLASTSIPTEGLDFNEITQPDEIALRFEPHPDITLMIDGGQGGAEYSTVVDLTDSSSPEVLRQGSGTF